MKENLHIRKRIRLENYDYSKENMYFITICIQDRLEILGKIVEENKIDLTKEGSIAKQNIIRIEEIYDNIVIDEHIIRNEKEYLKVKEYIRNNIINWKKDEYF